LSGETLARDVVGKEALGEIAHGWRGAALLQLAERIGTGINSAFQPLRFLARRRCAPVRKGADRIAALPAVFAPVSENESPRSGRSDTRTKALGHGVIDDSAAGRRGG